MITTLLSNKQLVKYQNKEKITMKKNIIHQKTKDQNHKTIKIFKTFDKKNTKIKKKIEKIKNKHKILTQDLIS